MSALLNRREVAELAGIPLNSVDKTIEQGIVRPRRRGRQSLLTIEDLALLTILGGVGLRLPASAKRRVREWVREQRPHRSRHACELALAPALVIRSGPEVGEATRRAERYLTGRDRWIESNPAIGGGEPVVKGTRVPVRSLARQIELGEARDVLREDYPHVPEEAFEVAPLWARTHPRRGRPTPPGTAGDVP